MKITKFAHCSLLVDTAKARILFDPGIYSGDLSAATDLDAVIITHQHSDHLDIDKLKTVLSHNDGVTIITHDGPSEQLRAANIDHELLRAGQSIVVGSSQIEAFEAPHEQIYHDFNLVPNLGFLIDEEFCFAGDSFHLPPKTEKIKLLALPVCAPWLKISEAIDYAKKIKPPKCIPVHDGFLIAGGPFHRGPKQLLGEAGIDFVSLDNGASIEV